MIISRVNAGFIMIGFSLFLLLTPGLMDDPEAPMGVAVRALVENFVFIATVAFMVVGIYFAFFSKACPVCGEKLSRSAMRCKCCGRIFKKKRE